MSTLRIPAAFVAATLAAALTACASTSHYADTRGYPAPYAASCYDCGTVESVRPIETTGTASGAGAVIGGVVGGAVGSQVGGGDGKKAATVAGVVGGAIAGNAIEKNMHKTSYELVVRMDDGRQLTVVQGDIADSLRVGSRVRLSGGAFDLL